MYDRDWRVGFGTFFFLMLLTEFSVPPLPPKFSLQEEEVGEEEVLDVGLFFPIFFSNF